jgi:hypothetical protein
MLDCNGTDIGFAERFKSGRVVWKLYGELPGGRESGRHGFDGGDVQWRQ